MSGDIGTLAWMNGTGGELQSSDARKLLLKGLILQLKLLPEQWFYRWGLRQPRDLNLTLDALIPPDSAAAVRAAALCREASAEYLWRHCERSYLWGRILAALYGLRVDEELLYVAAMLHDMGLTETYGAGAERPSCFTQIGADHAKEVLQATGWASRRADAVQEAITLHLNLAVDLAHGPEAHLLNQATALDVTGIRLWKLRPELVGQVLAEHPRCGQNAALAACWSAEAKRFPRSRAGWLEKNLKFSRRASAAPFED
jgi:hypothetical protein